MPAAPFRLKGGSHTIQTRDDPIGRVGGETADREHASQPTPHRVVEIGIEQRVRQFPHALFRDFPQSEQRVIGECVGSGHAMTCGTSDALIPSCRHRISTERS